jgi:hypothetical protein
MEAEVDKEGKKLLKKIPHEGGEISLEYKVYKGNCGEVAEAIDGRGLIMLVSSEVASLIYDAWINPRGECEFNILDRMEKNWIWENTGRLYLPKEKGEIQNGVIFQDNPLIVNRKVIMNRNDLIRKLYDAEEFRIKGYPSPILISKDRLVRFVRFGYKIGMQSAKDLEENPCIIGRYLGRKNNELEGASKIAIIASKYAKDPFLYSFNSVNEEKIIMSGLDKALDDFGLIIGCNAGSSFNNGYGFGKPKDKSLD